MSAQRLSTLPPAPLGGGPVLCMNIGGTVLTGKHWGCPRGFARFVFNHQYLSVHPKLPDWFEELDDAYLHCAWISSLDRRCAALAHSAGLTRAAAWPYLVASSPYPPTLWYRLFDVMAQVDSNAPVAVVDVNMAPWVFPDRCVPVDEPVRETIPLFLKRPGPTLLVAPALHIGLSQRIVDLLCRFAHDPVAPEFDVRGVHRMHHDPAQRWPDPLPPSLEEPVLHPLVQRERKETGKVM